MVGCTKGFGSRMKEKNPDRIFTYCFLHREAFVSKTLLAAADLLCKKIDC